MAKAKNRYGNGGAKKGGNDGGKNGAHRGALSRRRSAKPAVVRKTAQVGLQAGGEVGGGKK